MKDLLQLWTKSLLLTLTLIVFAVMLTGCAGHMKVVCEKPAPLPVTLSQAAVARCENLLRESVGLIEEGRSLLLRNAAVHDALVSTHD